MYTGQKVVCMNDPKRSRLDVMVFFFTLSLSPDRLCSAVFTASPHNETITTTKVDDKRRQA